MARVLEPHLDAVAILAEDGQEPSLSSTWGVWLRGPRGTAHRATRQGRAVGADGTQPWCSLAGVVTHALVTAWLGDDERRLFAVEMSHPGSTVEEGAWVPSGLADVITTPVRMSRSLGSGGRDRLVPAARRFLVGGIGVAAVWYGGAVGLARRLAAHVGSRDPDQLSLMHLGEVYAALSAARSALADAAVRIDDVLWTCGDAAAARVRHIVATAVEEVERHVAHALGPGRLNQEPEHVARVADLALYVRQHHADGMRPHWVGCCSRTTRSTSVVTFPPRRPAPEPRSDGRPAPRSLPRVMLDPAEVAHMVVVAAHPDDESLGVGGLLSQAARSGLRLSVVVATDGEASHPASPTHSAGQPGRLRQDAEACRRPVAPTASVRFLGHPDGRLADHEEELLVSLVQALGDGRVPSLLPGDTTGTPTTRRPVGLRRRPPPHPSRSGVPIWFWHWGTPSSAPWDRFRVLALDDLDVATKAAAQSLDCSQVEPLSDRPENEVPPGEDAPRHFAGDREIYVAEAPSDLALDELHAQHDDPWGTDSVVERDPQADQLLLAALPRSEFRHALEVGSSTWAPSLRTSRIAATDPPVIDAGGHAVAAARKRLGSVGHVRVEQRGVPRAWPEPPEEGVRPDSRPSEVGYFLSPRDLDAVVGNIRERSLTTAFWCCVTGDTRSPAGRWTVRACTPSWSRPAYVRSQRATSTVTSSCWCSQPRASSPIRRRARDRDGVDRRLAGRRTGP